MSERAFIEHTKNVELRDSLNYRGIPSAGAGARLATQQGTRGAPIADASCVPGLELFKVSPFAGTGASQTTDGVSSFENTNDFMWSSANNLDLAFMMWNQTQTTLSSNPSLFFGIMLRGNVASEIQPSDVFGAPVSQLVLVSGTFAWRINFNTVFSRQTTGQYLSAGSAFTTSEGTINSFQIIGPNLQAGTQFQIQTPLDFSVLVFNGSGRLDRSSSPSFVNTGGGVLLDLMSANYAGFRIYDFTLGIPDGTGWRENPATMPQSSSGALSNTARIPDPDDVSQTIGNPDYWYIEDAVVAAPAERTISRNASWVSERTVAANTDLTISGVAAAAFEVSPASAGISVLPSPPSGDIANATYSWNPTTSTFVFSATTAGAYRVVFNGLLTEEPGRRADAVLNITVT